MKTDNRVPLQYGYLTFLRDRLEITDNCRMEKILILIGFFSSTLYGLWCVLAYTGAGNPVMYYSGILILLTWAFATPFLIKRTYKQVLFYKEIGKINMQENYGGEYRAMFRLKRGKIRFVHLDKNKKHVKLFVRKLNELHIKTEFQSLTA
ncbi:MAG: hypothetical protein MI975_10270 [Cytophagales bacterium]|nr:hypothetical protein [Cytophagales bacterium]